MGNVSLEIIVKGDGKNFPKKGQIVTVHYTGFFTNKTSNQPQEFDSSRKRNRPFKFRLGVGEVIKGWDEGMRAKITMPPDCAYGKKGFPGLIPEETTITFDVELISFS